HNPARIKSTGAKIDAASIKKRPCFLCKANRPAEQLCGEWIPSWELLVNPYPILPIHFTIVNTFHRPQDGIPLEMAVMAEKAPDLAIFYNGAKAGASAPDHRHCQAVLKSELPLLKLAEKHHLPGMPPIISSEKFGLDLPFNFLSAIVTPDREGGITLQTMTLVKGVDGQTGKPDSGLVNAFFWISDTGYLRIIVIPRKAHRPECYSAEDETQMTVSPGALDMAGIMIMPVRKDYDRMNPELAEKIYGEVAFKGSIPPEVLS
ncbi:MAG: DUF4922 domain-containing protein, partial [Muribaculaceae bacterium]|nr:DUF4922 domain-containing protein [Muribaculaceae bacterium]